MGIDPMKLMRGMLISFVVLVLVVVLTAFLLPQTAHMERSIVIERPQKMVFTVLNGYRNFSEWSPWSELDPDMEVTLEGPMQGVGARYIWTSEEASVGAGSQEIVSSTPDSEIRVNLEFSGMSSSNSATYILEPEEGGTRVTWTHDADFSSSLFSRYFGLMLDSMIGADYERGLSQLKAFVESIPDADFADLDVSYVNVEPITIAYLAGSSATTPESIAEAYDAAFESIRDGLRRQGLKPTGPPLVIGKKWEAESNVYEFDAAYQVSERLGSLRQSSGIKLGKTYSGKVLKATHRGPYSELAEHFQKLMAYKRAMGYRDNGSPWDVYVSDPQRTPQAELLTETYVPVE